MNQRHLQRMLALLLAVAMLCGGALSLLAATKAASPKAFKWSHFEYPKAVEPSFDKMDTSNKTDDVYTFFTKDKRDTVLSYYRKKIAAIGWKLNNDFLSDGFGMIVAVGKTDIVQIAVGIDEDSGRVAAQLLYADFGDAETAASVGHEFELHMRGDDPNKAPGIDYRDAGLSWVRPSKDGLPWKEMVYPKARVIGYGALPDAMLGTEGFPSMTLYTTASIKEIMSFYEKAFAKQKLTAEPASISSADAEGAELFAMMGMEHQLWYYAAESKDGKLSANVSVFQTEGKVKRVRVSFLPAEK